MKYIFFLFLTLLFSAVCLFPQERFTALITDPQTGSKNGENFLTSVVEDINNRNEIESVVILGNLTFRGKEDEFLAAKSILDRLKIPVSFVGGSNDILLSEGKGNEFNQYWGNSTRILNQEFNNRISLETIPKQIFTKGHIPIEILNSSESYNSADNLILTFSYYPLDESVDNWFTYTNKLEGKKIVSFSALPVGNEKTSGFIKHINGSSLREGKDWEYNIIGESSDSLKIFTVSEKKNSPLLLDECAKSDLREVTKIDSAQTLIYPKNAELNIISSLDRSTYSPSIYSDGKLFLALEDGRIICLNNSGEKVWDYNTNGSIYSSILKDRDLIIAMTSDGDLFTINANNGDLIQVIGTGESISSDIRLIDLEYNELQTKGIIFGTSSGNIYCYELYSLEMVWDNNLTNRKIISHLLITKDKIIYRDDSQTYYCVNAVNGLLIWSWKPRTKSTNLFFQCDVISDGKSVFIVDSDGNLHSIDLLLGTETWNKQKLNSSGKILIKKESNELFIHSIKNIILVISNTDRKTREEIALPEELKNSIPTCWASGNDDVIVGFNNGFIIKIDSSKKASIILFAGNSPISSLVNTNANEFIAINLDGKVIQFTTQ